MVTSLFNHIRTFWRVKQLLSITSICFYDDVLINYNLEFVYDFYKHKEQGVIAMRFLINNKATYKIANN